MYGLPKSVDLSFLVGATLIQVCVGENEVVLNFDGDISVMSASSVRYAQAGERDAVLFEEARPAGQVLLGLLGTAISEVANYGDGTVGLLWSSGERVELLDSWKEYESYTIRHGDLLIVV